MSTRTISQVYIPVSESVPRRHAQISKKVKEKFCDNFVVDQIEDRPFRTRGTKGYSPGVFNGAMGKKTKDLDRLVAARHWWHVGAPHSSCSWRQMSMFLC